MQKQHHNRDNFDICLPLFSNAHFWYAWSNYWVQSKNDCILHIRICRASNLNALSHHELSSLGFGQESYWVCIFCKLKALQFFWQSFSSQALGIWFLFPSQLVGLKVIRIIRYITDTIFLVGKCNWKVFTWKRKIRSIITLKTKRVGILRFRIKPQNDDWEKNRICR